MFICGHPRREGEPEPEGCSYVDILEGMGNQSLKGVHMWTS